MHGVDEHGVHEHGVHEHGGVVLAVHGGAGAFDTAVDAASAHAGLTTALEAGLAALRAGGGAVAAAVAAVRVLEDDEQFNAGRGSVLTSAGTVENDAAVADGWSGRAGAVGAVQGVRNPVELARAVLDLAVREGAPVLLTGAGAGDLARALGLATEPASYFVTERARREHAARTAPGPGGGTVGAVARDALGHLAAATSTGGRPGKRPGRVGDSPVPGAGTWADDATCAISATGAGEAFLLAAFAHEVDARLRLAGAGLAEACAAALELVGRRGGTGGCIALSADGRLAAPFSSPGMLRGWAYADGRIAVAGPVP